MNFSNKKNQEGLPEHSVHTRGMPLDVLAPIYDRYCPLIGLGRAFRQTTIRYAELMSGDSVLDVVQAVLQVPELVEF